MINLLHVMRFQLSCSVAAMFLDWCFATPVFFYVPLCFDAIRWVKSFPTDFFQLVDVLYQCPSSGVRWWSHHHNIHITVPSQEPITQGLSLIPVCYISFWRIVILVAWTSFQVLSVHFLSPQSIGFYQTIHKSLSVKLSEFSFINGPTGFYVYICIDCHF